ncbi:phage holin family protein [Sphingomonas flavalba]|uniref:phage holin family protein n=1 Tax=Sphingomonas flavalba TaxID=2559804 RepID=UPI0039DF93C8
MSDNAPDTERPPIGELFAGLIEDTERYVRAELTLQRAKLVDRLLMSRAALAMAVGAIILVQAAISALLVGIVLALAPRLGALGAALLVTVIALAIAGALLAAAFRWFDRATQIAEEP